MKHYPFPHLRTKLPGPQARRIIATDERFVSPSYTRGYPCVAEKGRDVILTDIDGNEFLDFCAGIAVCATGHCHPEIVAAIKAQAEKLIHMSGTDFYYEVQAVLARKLNRLAPGSHQNHVFFTNSGAESIEAAIKLARYKTGRSRLVAYIGAFHGRTLGALSLTGSKVIQKQGFAPLLQGVTHIPYPYCFRCQFGQKNGSCRIECFKYLENILFQKTVPPTEVAAIFIEPIQGEGGYVVPPREYLVELQKLARKFGILLVADEVQCGMGRTGRMFASEHFGFVPDIICTAKGIASGMPLGAIIARADIMDWPPGSHASTFGGNPIACAAALKTIELLEHGLMGNATRMGNYLMQRLQRMMKKHAIIGDVRGIGLMVGIEIVKNRRTNEPDPKTRDKILDEAFYQGLILLGCGPNSIRFAPALTVTRDHIDCCLGILERIIRKIRKR
ncbi:MAG: acetyl ornithine aminotransferase family protein [Opitutaceae bacterium]|nr:acetyl ornithine aminotransferase family protein [Opitutaceae bacterium]